MENKQLLQTNLELHESRKLLECCDEDLRKDLTCAAGETLTEKSEADVLKAIKTLAVREENTMVARVALHEM